MSTEKLNTLFPLSLTFFGEKHTKGRKRGRSVSVYVHFLTYLISLAFHPTLMSSSIFYYFLVSFNSFMHGLDCLENVGASTSHNPKGLQGL
jgi:hypothetical protein